jgi:haloacetate dehalogenase
MRPKIPGFEYLRVGGEGGISLQVAMKGQGPPVLLLHGFPETHLAWREVAPRLARKHRVVCADLRGYGDSDKPAGDPEHQQYAKRTMARDAVRLMARLGCPRFAVVGHDRGGLVALRTALDHPDQVSHLAVLDILPTSDMWRALQGVAGVFAFHLYLLAQPAPLPEHLLGANPTAFFGHFFDAWTKVPGAIPPELRETYLLACRDPASVHAICEDYRASAFVDPQDEEADRRTGRRIQVPTLAMWQDPGDQPLPFDPRAIWASWASDLQTAVLPCGHFLPEERPTEVAAALETLLAR